MFTFVGSYTFNEKKKLYKLLLIVNFKLVVTDIIMTCLLLSSLTHLMRGKKKQKTKKKTLCKLLLIVNFKLVVTNIIMICFSLA